MADHDHSEDGDDRLVQIDKVRKESVNLYLNYFLTRNLDELDQAVRCARAVLGVLIPGVFHPPTVGHLGRALVRRFQHTKHVEDITEAVERLRHVLLLVKDDSHPLYRASFDFLSFAYLERDGNVDGLLDLNVPHAYIQSIPSLETLVKNLDLGEAEQVFEYFKSRVTELYVRYIDSMKMEDLDAAIQLCRHALGFFSHDSDERGEKRGSICNVLGTYLTSRFQIGQSLEDINEAIEIRCVGLELQSPDSPMFWLDQCSASYSYMRRFEALTRREDLDTAVRLAKEAVEVIETQYADFTKHRKFARCLDFLAYALGGRYGKTGDVNDLEAAIDASSRAVDTVLDGNKELPAEVYKEIPSWLETLDTLLTYRYWRSSRAEDFIEAIATGQKALDYWPPNHPRRVSILLNLCVSELNYFQVLQDPKCLDRAREHIEEACHIREVNPGLKETVDIGMFDTVCQFISYYSSCSGSDDVPIDVKQFGSTKTRAIDAAIDIARICISFAHNTGKIVDAMNSQLSLSQCLAKRWESPRGLTDLDEAIIAARRGIELAEELGEYKVHLILARTNLGEYLHWRFQCTNSIDNREEALSVLLQAFRMSSVHSHLQMTAGRLAIDILVEKADWDNACKLSREIINLLVILIGRSHAWESKEYLVRAFDLGAATYASIALEAGSSVPDAIDMLETCRGSILGHLIDKQADLDDLTDAAPAKAELFRTLQNEISTGMGPVTNTNIRLKHISRRIEAEGEIRACLREIRSLNGFHRFLLGPAERELKEAAARGPIIIVNVTAVRSDAIIVTKDAFDCLPLPGLKQETVQGYIDKGLTDFTFETLGSNNKQFGQFLGWLWDNCVKLIFEKLKDFGYGPAKFRVWWVGVGVATFLPFHAAGKYDGKARENGKYVGKARETALSLAISSYTPTLRVLIHSQRKLLDEPPELALQRVTLKQQATGNSKPKLTLITMPSTAGMRNLDGVQEEAEWIQSIVGETFCTQILVQPSAKETMAHMAESEIVHFACHGESDVRDPSASHLLLQATAPNASTPAIDKLKVRDVVDADLGHGKLAFLSACSTAQNRDKLLQDEVLHLVSGFQVAGYLHAIGNLWPADDDKSADLVKEFYRHLVAAGDFGMGDHVAEALNKAMLGMAEKYPKQPLSWAPFVHFGV